MTTARKYYLTGGILVLLILVARVPSWRGSSENMPSDIRCALALGGKAGPEMTLSTGFHYEFLRKAEEASGGNMEICLAQPGKDLADSLLAGNIDIAVVRAGSPVSRHKKLRTSRTLPDSVVWVYAKGGPLGDAAVEFLILSVESRKDYSKMIDRFVPTYDPFARRRSSRKYLSGSPYDNIIKDHSKTLGWDWRLLMAVIWQESRFRIESRSHKGAEGLMQLMPLTAKHMGVDDDLLDPEKNIEAGVKYLLRQQKALSAEAESPRELSRMTLAAYNAGEGRVRDCLRLAKAKGMKCRSWSELKSVMATLADGEMFTLDSVTVSLSPWSSRETVNYVERIDSLYSAFCAIVP